MSSKFVAYCDACGLPTPGTPIGDYCPRCRYPINRDKEEAFLRLSIRDLQRIADYGGANMTVANLIQRYQSRLRLLRQIAMAPVEMAQPSKRVTPELSSLATAPLPPPPKSPPAETVHFPARPAFPVTTPTNFVPVQNSQLAPHPVFSLKSFFADQTINIVASLGALFVLIGSLSFVATTKDLLLSFLAVFIVHAIFGITGAASYRFQSFRTVAVIYTAIFALLVPLVGFSCYRLIAGNLIQLSTPTLVAIVATYAAITYGFLAVYQKFSPFAYLSLVALTVADLASANAFALGYWWWPSALMLLALAAVVSFTPTNRTPFRGSWTIWREPIRVLMFTCVTACGLGIIFTFIYSLIIPTPDIRFSIVSMSLLLLCWTCLFIWRTQRNEQAPVVPYLFLTLVLALSYAFTFDQSGYALALTAAALLYHGLNRFASHILQPFGKTALHMENLALVLVGFVPFIFGPFLPLAVFEKAYVTGFVPTLSGTLLAPVIVLIGTALTISTMLHHTGLRRTPDASQARWCWLILYSGSLFTWAYGIIVPSLNIEPVWCFLAITLALLVATVATRHFVGASWANPLDVLALGEAVITLSLSFHQYPDRPIALFLYFAAASYGVLLFQQRYKWLFVPFIFAVLALPLLSERPQETFVLSLALPFLSVVVHRFITNKLSIADTPVQQRSVAIWEWPLLAIGLICGLMILGRDAWGSISTVQGWFNIPFPAALEMAVLSLTWYVAAALARVKWWLPVAVGFAIIALLFPNTPFWILAWLAPTLALFTYCISLLVSRTWVLPLYIVALFAAIMMGIAASIQGQIPAATWVLFLFAILIYLIGIADKEPALMWTAPFFAIWSVYYSGQIGDFYRAPIVALTCVTLGATIGYLRFYVLLQSNTSQINRFLRYALPFYATALASALLTGIHGMLAGTNHPFFLATPAALLVYAALAYGVSLIERRAGWLWLVAGFSLWGAWLIPQAAACSNDIVSSCNAQVQSAVSLLTGTALLSGIFGLLAGRLVKQGASKTTEGTQARALFTWSWPWYLASLGTMIITANYFTGTSLSHSPIELSVLCSFIVLALVIMLVEHTPEMIIVPLALAVWTIARIPWALWQQMIMYNLLCVLTFASQSILGLLSPTIRKQPRTDLHKRLALGGQVLVVLTILVQGEFTGALGHVGAGSLLVLALLTFCFGHLQSDKSVQRWCAYTAGLFSSFAISWELLALGQRSIDILLLAPGSYLIVIAPFLSRDETLPEHHRIGQICSILGAICLLLPTLWLSFGSSDNLQATLLLAGEAMALLLLGIGTRTRILALSGAGFVIVSGIHALFLPSLDIPPFLALAVLGGILLACATTLKLIGRRLQIVLTEWE